MRQRWTSAKMVVQRNIYGALILGNGWKCNHFETRRPGPWKSYVEHHIKFPQTNAEDSISSNSCGLHWIIDPLQTMIVIACWISCYPDSIAVDLPPEFLAILLSHNDVCFMEVVFPIDMAMFPKESLGNVLCLDLGQISKTLASSHQKKKKLQKSQVLLKQKLYRKQWRWSFHPHTFDSHISLNAWASTPRMMMPSPCAKKVAMSCYPQVPLVNRTGPSPQPNKHRCGMLWVIPRAPKFCGCFMICVQKHRRDTPK